MTHQGGWWSQSYEAASETSNGCGLFWTIQWTQRAVGEKDFLPRIDGCKCVGVGGDLS